MPNNRLIPIFDTSAILNLSKRDKADPFWKRLKSLLPRRGSPLSFITVLELIHGLIESEDDRIDETLKPILVASDLSRQRVLLSPFPFVESELFGLTNSKHERSRGNLGRWLRAAIKSDFKNDFRDRIVSGISLAKIEYIFDHTRSNVGYLSQFLDSIHPAWREERRRTGSSVPEATRTQIMRTYSVTKWKEMLPGQLLNAMNIENTHYTVEALRTGCDAYFTYTTNILRDSTISNYNFENNSNDFHDGMQLLYLCRPSFCIVTDDKRLVSRSNKSTQAPRVLTTDQFISHQGSSQFPAQSAK